MGPLWRLSNVTTRKPSKQVEGAELIAEVILAPAAGPRPVQQTGRLGVVFLSVASGAPPAPPGQRFVRGELGGVGQPDRDQVVERPGGVNQGDLEAIVLERDDHRAGARRRTWVRSALWTRHASRRTWLSGRGRRPCSWPDRPRPWGPLPYPRDRPTRAGARRDRPRGPVACGAPRACPPAALRSPTIRTPGLAGPPAPAPPPTVAADTPPSSSRPATSRLGLAVSALVTLQVGRIALLQTPIVAPAGAVPPLLLGQLVPGHDHQQSQQLVGLLEVILARGRPHEEAGHHRLADVGPVESAVEPRIAQPHSHLAADDRLVALDQLTGRLVVAGANPADEIRERGALRHVRLLPCRHGHRHG